MRFMNRTTLIGRLAENPRIFFAGKDRIATFNLLTPAGGTCVDECESFQKHHILVEDSLWIDYAESCFSEGNLVFVEGWLDQIAGDYGHSWIIISKRFGELHPIHSHAHTFKKAPHSFS